MYVYVYVCVLTFSWFFFTFKSRWWCVFGPTSGKSTHLAMFYTAPTTKANPASNSNQRSSDKDHTVNAAHIELAAWAEAWATAWAAGSSSSSSHSSAPDKKVDGSLHLTCYDTATGDEKLHITEQYVPRAHIILIQIYLCTDRYIFIYHNSNEVYNIYRIFVYYTAGYSPRSTTISVKAAAAAHQWLRAFNVPGHARLGEGSGFSKADCCCCHLLPDIEAIFYVQNTKYKKYQNTSSRSQSPTTHDVEHTVNIRFIQTW